MNPSALEERYAALQAELGAFNLGESIRLLAQIPVTDESWDAVFDVEIDRCLKLYAEHYAEFDKPVTIAVGGGQIKSSREKMIAAIGFLQGATFLLAALQEQGLTSARIGTDA